jgi:hypothetical protein
VAGTGTVETEQAAKKGGRKPDPMARIVNDVKASIKSLGDYEAKEYPVTRNRYYDERSAVWARQYGREGTLDALVLSYAHEVLASLNDAERRHALLQLAAVAINEVSRLDGAE